MADDRSRTLEHAADLEARDEAIAADLARVTELLRRAAGARDRALELDEFLASLPGERAALDREEAHARDARAAAEQELADAERRRAELERKHRTAQERLVQAARAAARAAEAVADAAARLERIAERRRGLEDDECAAQAEADGLAVEAATVAGAVQDVPRVSESGRSRPGRGLRELSAWAERVHAALLVVRSSLDVDRERIVREANELGAVVLGEQLGGTSVALVRRRIVDALGG